MFLVVPLCTPAPSALEASLPKEKQGEREQADETNKQWERLSGKHKAVVMVETERENRLYSEEDWKGSRGWAWLSVQLSLDGNVLLHSIFLSVLDCLLFNNRPSRLVCIYTTLCIWLGWGRDRGEVQNWGLLTPLIAHPPPVPALGSEAGGAESDSQAKGGNLAYLFWNFIILNYLDQDGSPSLLSSLLLLSTLSRKHVSSHSLFILLSVCLLLGFLPLHVLLHHCLSNRLAFLICHFQPCLLSGSFF